MAVTDPKKTDPRKALLKKSTTAAQKLKQKGKATVKLGRQISKVNNPAGKVVKQEGRAMKKQGRQTARAARKVKSNAESIRTRKWLS